jgi:hypothetical protein
MKMEIFIKILMIRELFYDEKFSSASESFN